MQTATNWAKQQSLEDKIFLGWSPTGDAFKTSHQTCSTSVSTRLISVCWNQFYVSVNTDVLNTFNSIVVNVPPYQSYGQEISYRELLLLNIITGATASMQQQQQCRDKCPDKEDIWYEKKQTKLLSKYHLPSASPSHSHTHTHTPSSNLRKNFLPYRTKLTCRIHHVITAAGSYVLWYIFIKW